MGIALGIDAVRGLLVLNLGGSAGADSACAFCRARSTSTSRLHDTKTHGSVIPADHGWQNINCARTV
jgi:hypothetical protein